MPARFRDIIRLVVEFGGEIEEPKSGSHWKAKRLGFGSYPIPAHNGPKTEIDDCYIRGLCRSLQFDEVEFRKKL